MKIRVGYELIYDFPQSTPMIMVLGIHFTRASDVITPDYLTTSPSVPISPYRDIFGNWCSRIVAPAGRMRLSANGVVRDRALSRCRAASAKCRRLMNCQAAATAVHHVVIATARSARCVWAEMRWRWTLKVL